MTLHIRRLGSGEDLVPQMVAVTEENRTIFHPDVARACVDSGGRIHSVRGCVYPDGTTYQPGDGASGGSAGPGSADPPGSSSEAGLTTNQKLMIGGGVVVLGALAYVAFRK